MKSAYVIILMNMAVIAMFAAIIESYRTKYNNEVDEVYNLKMQLDSCNEESFNYLIKASRYEMAVSIYQERDSINAEKFKQIFNTETE